MLMLPQQAQALRPMAVEVSKASIEVVNPLAFGLVTTDPSRYNPNNFSFLSHGGIGDWDNAPRLDRLFEDIECARDFIFCTFWNTPSKWITWSNTASLILDISDGGEVLWAGSPEGRLFFPLRFKDIELRNTKLEMRRDRERMQIDLSSYPEEFKRGIYPYEVDVTGARIAGIWLQLPWWEDFGSAHFEFVALAIKYNLPIAIKQITKEILKEFFDNLDDQQFIRTLKKRALYTDDYKEKIRLLLVVPTLPEPPIKTEFDGIDSVVKAILSEA